MYTVRGKSAATAATADHAVCGFWNPHSTQRIKVVSVSIFTAAAPTGVPELRLRRTTATGTAGSTVTPNISNHSIRGIAPVSGALLHLAAYSVQPTLEASAVDFGFGWFAPLVAGSGIVYPIPGGIEIGPGAGIALIQVAATIFPASQVTFSWLEDW
jgi:hypothetical protein